jgi:hypothetical protein
MQAQMAAIAVTLSMLLSVHVTPQEARHTLERRSLLGGRVSALVPVEFTQMSAEMIQKKYPSANRPNLVFTNAQTTVNVALEHTSHPLGVNDLPKAQESIRSTFKSSYPSAKWFRDEIKSINGRSFFVIDIRTPAVDTQVRNIMAGTSLDDRLFIASVNMTMALEAEWLSVANQIVESITIK